jgi:hypothetical protein
LCAVTSLSIKLGACHVLYCVMYVHRYVCTSV